MTGCWLVAGKVLLHKLNEFIKWKELGPSLASLQVCALHRFIFKVLSLSASVISHVTEHFISSLNCTLSCKVRRIHFHVHFNSLQHPQPFHNHLNPHYLSYFTLTLSQLKQTSLSARW